MSDWRSSAACLGLEPELFFPPTGATDYARAQTDDAKAVCRRCPVRGDCLAWALNNQVTDGVWGGLSEGERAALKRRRYTDCTECGNPTPRRRGQGGFPARQCSDTCRHTSKLRRQAEHQARKKVAA